MSNAQRGLGRGLDALLGDQKNHASPVSEKHTPQTLPITSIIPNPNQPRRHFEEAALEDLAASIKSQGIIQPILVRPTPQENIYEIVAGERRWRAAQKAALQEIPVYIREVEDAGIMLAALIENLQREDLNPIEEALALQSLKDQYNMSQEDIAQQLGKARSSVTNTLRLLLLPPAIQTNVQKGVLSAGHARALLALPDVNAQQELCDRILEHHLSVRDAESAATAWKNGDGFPWAVEEKQPAGNPKSPRRKSPEALKIQKTLNKHLPCKATVSGDLAHGKITLAYSTKDELVGILRILGVAAAESN